MADTPTLAHRLDDLVNTLTGMGSTAKDKRLSVTYAADTLTQDQLEEWYRGNDLAASVVEVPVEEMFRRGFDLFLGDDEARQKTAMDVMSMLDERGFLDRLQEGFNFKRAYGGAGILLGADDGQALEQPLNESAIRSFEWMSTLTPAELRPILWNDDVTSPRYGEVELYELIAQRTQGQLVAINQKRPQVHHSRIIRLDGIRVSRRQRRSADGMGWGDSVLVRCYSVIRDYTAGWQGAATMLQHFAQSWMKLKGLSELLEEEDSSRALISRATAISMARNIANTVIMDAEEEMGVISTPLSGYPEMMQQFAIRLAAAARIPVTLLMGQSPAGLNATGESDVRNFYAHIARLQQKELRPALNRVLQLLFLSADGPKAGVEPNSWEVRFKPLWELTELQRAELMGKVAAADAAYIASGVLMPEEVAVSRFGTGEFSLSTTIDTRAREGRP